MVSLRCSYNLRLRFDWPCYAQAQKNRPNGTEAFSAVPPILAALAAQLMPLARPPDIGSARPALVALGQAAPR